MCRSTGTPSELKQPVLARERAASALDSTQQRRAGYATEHKPGHIGVVSRDGGPVEQLTDARGQSWPHSWAPDNDRIAFAGQRDGVWNLYSVSRRTRAVTQITFFTSGSGYVRYPAWSPSGSRIVFERALDTSNVWTMTLPPRE